MIMHGLSVSSSPVYIACRMDSRCDILQTSFHAELFPRKLNDAESWGGETLVENTNLRCSLNVFSGWYRMLSRNDLCYVWGI